jgi:hypothetical protein
MGNVNVLNEPKIPTTSRKVFEMDYTNWKGERAWQKVQPMYLFLGVTKLYPKPQWLLHVLDTEKGEFQDFALASIHAVLEAK